ncbi:Legume lectin domain [Dillenia turbinata]|uniref:Legume lectin domain n=1 Tax=Dillenia turbinata TaxID=194707 RepID=A0AAN8W047_9MAGN
MQRSSSSVTRADIKDHGLKSGKSSGSSLDSQLTRRRNKLLIPDSSARVVSGPFADFSGSLKKLDHKAGKPSLLFPFLFTPGSSMAFHYQGSAEERLLQPFPVSYDNSQIVVLNLHKFQHTARHLPVGYRRLPFHALPPAMLLHGYFTALCLVLLYFEPLFADPLASFSYNNFDPSSDFGSELTLFGDAVVINGGSGIELCNSSVSSAGRVMYAKPIKFPAGNASKTVSFSTYFSFSLSPGNGDGMAFVLVPVDFPLHKFDGSMFGLNPGLNESKFKFFAVEFDTFKNVEVGDLNRNHVGIDVDSVVSKKTSNVSDVYLVLSSGQILHSWIDYDASSKRLEVRLSKLADSRPIDPLLVYYPIDLGKMWNNDQVYVGLSSSSGNSTQTSFVYSWSFKLWRVPTWMHSEPLDPNAFAERTDSPLVTEHKRSACVLRVLAALIFGTGCGALGALIVLVLWTMLGNRRPVVPEDIAVHPVKFDYENVKADVVKPINDGKKLDA